MKVAAIGECMIELSSTSLDQCSVGFGGDTLNTAIYMARLGTQIEYLTLLGDDLYSQHMLDGWKEEGVGINGVRQCKGRQSGLYMIHNDAKGERSFNYWRAESPARELFDDDYEPVFSMLSQCDCIYLSGITLSLYKDSSRKRLLEFLTSYRENDRRVVFDLNYRPANWASKESAQEVVKAFLPLVDIALPSFDDEVLLFGFDAVDACIAHYRDSGVRKMVLKDGLNGCYLVDGEVVEHIPVPVEVQPRDTTAAGDSFNAGFLAAMAKGLSDRDAVVWGQNSAATVIQEKGAIVDKIIYQNAMQSITNQGLFL